VGEQEPPAEDWVAKLNAAAFHRLEAAKLRLAAFLLAVGGFAADEDGRSGRAPATAEERAAYGLLYGRLGRELAGAYREAFMTGTLAQDRDAAPPLPFGQLVTVPQLGR
jgi:hypothetical protein